MRCTLMRVWWVAKVFKLKFGRWEKALAEDR